MYPEQSTDYLYLNRQGIRDRDFEDLMTSKRCSHHCSWLADWLQISQTEVKYPKFPGEAHNRVMTTKNRNHIPKKIRQHCHCLLRLMIPSLVMINLRSCWWYQRISQKYIVTRNRKKFELIWVHCHHNRFVYIRRLKRSKKFFNLQLNSITFGRKPPHQGQGPKIIPFGTTTTMVQRSGLGPNLQLGLGVLATGSSSFRAHWWLVHNTPSPLSITITMICQVYKINPHILMNEKIFF